MKKVIIISILIAVMGFFYGYRTASKKPLVPQSPQIVRVYKATTVTDNPDIVVKTPHIAIKKINNRGDKKILPLKQEITDKRTGEVTVATTSIPQVIKNDDLGKLKVIGYAVLRDQKVNTYGGIVYEVFYLGNFNCNVGLGYTGLIGTIGYSFKPSLDGFIGYDGERNTVLGVSVRI